MPSGEGGVFVLSKKAFISTVVAIALNPIGVAVGYGVGKWLQAPKLTVQTLNVDVATAGIQLPKDMLPILQGLQATGVITTWRFKPDEQERLKKGNLTSAAARSIASDAEAYMASLAMWTQILQDNITATQQWSRGQDLIVKPIVLANGASMAEAPQTIVNRNKNELLGIYRSELRDIQGSSDDAGRLMNYLQAQPANETRTGEATIVAGILNSGDSEGVVYPKALLRSAAGEIDLAPSAAVSQSVAVGNVANAGGYVVVPPRSFREITFAMGNSTRGNAAENWKKLVQSGRGDDVTVILQTSGGSLLAKGKLPL